jgi:hypothetical protein
MGIDVVLSTKTSVHDCMYILNLSTLYFSDASRFMTYLKFAGYVNGIPILCTSAKVIDV